LPSIECHSVWAVVVALYYFHLHTLLHLLEFMAHAAPAGRSVGGMFSLA
jgi:hypothetical protein